MDGDRVVSGLEWQLPDPHEVTLEARWLEREIRQRRSRRPRGAARGRERRAGHGHDRAARRCRKDDVVPLALRRAPRLVRASQRQRRWDLRARGEGVRLAGDGPEQRRDAASETSRHRRAGRRRRLDRPRGRAEARVASRARAGRDARLRARRARARAAHVPPATKRRAARGAGDDPSARRAPAREASVRRVRDAGRASREHRHPVPDRGIGADRALLPRTRTGDAHPLAAHERLG